MNRNEFKNFLREWVKNDIMSQGRVLVEAPEDQAELLDVDGNDSLDEQVDRYFSQYQSSASKEAVKESRRRLFEAGEDEEQDEEAEADEGGDETDAAAEPVKKAGLSKINVSSFAADVARLIENYDSLLEVKSTIARRAATFLSESYDERVIMEFESVLQEEHGISANKSKWDIDAEDHAPPAAERSGGTSSGGA